MKQFSNDEADDEGENYNKFGEENYSHTFAVQKLDEDKLSSSEDEKRFEKLNKIAGKYKVDEVFPKFKSPMLDND